jgi:hypothetical protein
MVLTEWVFYTLFLTSKLTVMIITIKDESLFRVDMPECYDSFLMMIITIIIIVIINMIHSCAQIYSISVPYVSAKIN